MFYKQKNKQTASAESEEESARLSERLEATEEELASLRSHSQSTLAAAEAKAKHAKLVRSVTVSHSLRQAGRQASRQ